MKYFSLFSGVGGFELGIKKVFPKAKCVGYSEIHEPSINVYEQKFPKHKNFGDVARIKAKKLPEFDLLVGGSPCQNLSRANMGNADGLYGEKSILFWEFLRILEKKKPKWFLLENVASMRVRDRDIITNQLGVEPVRLDSGLVSAGHRDRLYWCNWDVSEPEDKNIVWKDVKEHRGTKPYRLSGKELDFIQQVYESKKTHWNIRKAFMKSSLHAYSRSIRNVMKNGKKIGTFDERRFRLNGKLNTLVTSRGCGGSHSKNFIKGKNTWRLLTPIECARIQTFPDDWCSILSDNQAYKAYGNAVTVDMIAHIMSCHPKRNYKK